MKIQVALVAVLALMVAASLGLGSTAVRADDGPAPAPKEALWVHDVLVVRVDPADAATAERPLPFPTDRQTTAKLTRAEALAALKARGSTTVLMDTRLTARPGHKASAREESTTPILAPNFEDKNNLQLRSQAIKQGCQVALLSSGHLDYELSVSGTLTPPREKNPPVQYRVDWQASHDWIRDGRALVLHHRRQVAVHGEPPRQAVEHYAFLWGSLREAP